MDGLDETAGKYNMKINITKTKTMVVSKKEDGVTVIITIKGQKKEQVNNLKYLGR